MWRALRQVIGACEEQKKRARPGENLTPRPRNRQLIQDCPKELRELVPSGSKCSINALLEHIIKHMLFLQTITKDADKLDECAESKLHHNEPDIRETSNNEPGLSWTVEVGIDLKVYSIMVEDLCKKRAACGDVKEKNLTDEYRPNVANVWRCRVKNAFIFLRAEAIRSLGLTILRGVMDMLCG